MAGFVERFLDDLAGLGGGWLLVAAFLLAFGETAFLTDLLVPGDVGLVIVGAAAARDGPPLPALIVVASVGATLGDSVGWLVGRYGVDGLLRRWSWAQRNVEQRLRGAHSYFERRGGGAIFWGRFVGAARALVSVVAGMHGMPYRRFLGWNVLASIAWTSLVLTAGYLLGRHADTVVGDIGLVVTIAVVAAAALWFVVRRRRRPPRPGAEPRE
jgi:membrane protein DedA with SNARE-associated domain